MALRVLPLSQSRREPGTLLTNSFVSPAFICGDRACQSNTAPIRDRFLYWAAATKSVRPVLLTSCSSFRKAIGLAEVGVNMESSGVWRMTCESARDKFSDGSRPMSAIFRRDARNSRVRRARLTATCDCCLMENADAQMRTSLYPTLKGRRALRRSSAFSVVNVFN
jgi:hypothetical protein